jgi:elongator complex protein 1
MTCTDEASHLLPHLFQLSPEHREEGEELQAEVDAFGKELIEDVEWIWKKEELDPDQEPAMDSWANRMAEAERQRLINPSDKIAKPLMDGKKDWRIGLFEIER